MVDGHVALTVDRLSKTYHVAGLFRASRTVHALKETSLSLRRGETLGVIGKSGSGKSTLARCITRLIEPTSGSTVLGRSDGGRAMRQRMQIVFQDPFRSLNPRRTVGQSITEGPVNFGVPAPMLSRGPASSWISSVSIPMRSSAIRTSFPVVSASESRLPEHWPWSLTS